MLHQLQSSIKVPSALKDNGFVSVFFSFFFRYHPNTKHAVFVLPFK